jgi:xylan 1,4-beta-xylosidase
MNNVCRCLVIILVSVLSCNEAHAYLVSKDSIRNINADVCKIKGRRSMVYQECVGAGRAAEGLRADWQQQLVMVKKDIGFKYIRFHGLLNDEMHAYTEDDKGNPVYNWQYIDKLYDFLLSIKIRPFVELGFMPPALASGDKTVFWWKGNITPPKSYEKWSAFITALTKHFEERYGRHEVEQWYFEVWNEPNLNEFFTGDIKEYFKLYQVTAKAIKKVSQTYRVGGPATSGSTWIKEALTEFAHYPELVDFISTHAYGTKSVFDEYGRRRTQMREADGIAVQIGKLRENVNLSAFNRKEIHVTEWNSSPNPRDPLHDTYQNAAYILNALKNTETFVNSMSYWTFTDIFEEAGPPPTPFHGGFGLLNLQAIKKPSYLAYQYVKQLGNTELLDDDHSSWLTTDNSGNVQALIWDYHLLSPDSSYNQQFYSREIIPKTAGMINLNIDHLKNGMYKLQIYHIGYQRNDPYTAYLKMGSPSNLSIPQVQSLKALSTGRADEVKEIVVKDGSWNAHFSISQNEVVLIKLNRIK